MNRSTNSNANNGSNGVEKDESVFVNVDDSHFTDEPALWKAWTQPEPPGDYQSHLHSKSPATGDRHQNKTAQHRHRRQRSDQIAAPGAGSARLNATRWHHQHIAPNHESTSSLPNAGYRRGNMDAGARACPG